VCVGVIAGARGLKGEVRVRAYTARPEDVAAYGPVTDAAGTRTFRLTVSGRMKDRVIARIDGIDDRTQAEALKGVEIFVERAALPAPAADEFYVADLVGLGVERVGAAPGAAPFGRVKAVHDFGGGDVLEIERPGAASVMVPFSRAAVPEIDLAGGRLVLDPPAGLLDGEPAGQREGET